MLEIISRGDLDWDWGREGRKEMYIFSPSLLREEFSDVRVWDEVRGEVRNDKH